MTNTSNTSNQQNPTVVNFLDEELFYVTDDRNRLITKSREAVINFISHSAYREEIVIIRLDDGYIWELDDHTSKLIASGYIYYKDLYSLEKLISERTFPGSELFDLELANRKREKIKGEWQNILSESRDGHTSKERDNFFDDFCGGIGHLDPWQTG